MDTTALGMPHLLAAGGLALFFLLPLRLRMLISFAVMTKGFDLLPPVLFGVDCWDAGAVLGLLSALPLIWARVPADRVRPLYLVLLRVFYCWLLVCLVWSLAGFHYPWLHTLKTARQMVVGYLFVFIMFRLFLADPRALPFFVAWLYWISFAILPVCIAQSVLKLQLLFGLYREYGTLTRSLPVILPIALFFLWGILARFLCAERLRFHEPVYAALALVVVAFTYTRGIYLSLVLVGALLVVNLFYDRRLSLARLGAGVVLGLVCVAFLAGGGLLDSVLERFSSGVNLVLAKRVITSKRNVDSFTGRLALTRERFALVGESNPWLGLGFLHEEDVSPALRNALKSGSVISTPEYQRRYRFGFPYRLGLYTADIGWANLVLMTGFVGLVIFLAFLAAFLVSYYRRGAIAAPLYQLRLAFFLQTVMMALLMFNGDTFVAKLQVAGFMIAGYAVTTYRGSLAAAPSPGAAAVPAGSQLVPA